MNSDDRPFLTVFTRACKRPKMLRRNIQSVLGQKCKSIEQVFVVDNKERGLAWANASFNDNLHRVSGEYVYMLDDDTRFVRNDAVRDIMNTARVNGNPPVILVRIRNKSGDITENLPDGRIWGINWESGYRPKSWRGNGMCVVTRSDYWKVHVDAYAGGVRGEFSSGGDWHFVTSLIESGARFVRMQKPVIAETMQRGRGVVFEKCRRAWWPKIQTKFGIPDSYKKDYRQ